MDELTPILKQATAAIKSAYFHLNVDGGDPVYRERVYCYELYHQMRSIWPAECPYYLNGEIDKAAHPILESLGAAGTKPDLLAHRPGYMTGNHAIIEVKTSRARGAGIKKDLETLSLFINRVKYERAIYLVFGEEAERLVSQIDQIAEEIEPAARAELWLQTKSGASATPFKLIWPS